MHKHERNFSKIFLFTALVLFTVPAYAADTTPPTGSIKINNDAVSCVNTRAVTLNLSAADSGSGMGSGAQMKFSNDNVTWSAAQAYAVTKSWALLSGDGKKTVYVKYKDAAGNWSGAYSDTILLDTVVPAGSIKVNNNNTYTNSVSVTLNLSAQDNAGGSGLSQMKFSNNDSRWSAPEAYAITKSWTLTSGDGTKTVYVKYKDAAGNWSKACSDSVVLDTTAPAGKIKINNGAASTTSLNVTLNLSASDSRSGVSQMRFSNNNSTWSAPETYTATKAWTIASGNGTKYVYAKYKDNAGNWSSTVYDSIILNGETIPPTGSITINNNARYTNSASVTLNLSAQDNTGGSGLSQMQFSNNNSTWSAPAAYATTKSWTLTSGDGAKTVYVKFSDKLGNWSTAYSDSITLDTIAPVIVITNPKDNAVVTTPSLTVKYTSDGAAKTKQFTIVIGLNTITVTDTDAAGNTGSASIKVTLVKPLHITTTSLSDGAFGQDYSASLNAADGVPPYKWSVAGGALPDGLALDSATGVISGKAKAANTFNFTAMVTDAGLAAASQPFSINILPVPMNPDEELLDDTEARTASYFYNEALSNGFVMDRNQETFSSIATTGFGLASLCVMAERYGTTSGWTVTPAQAKARANQILDNCIAYQNAQTAEGNEYGIAGFLYHFIIQDGTRQGSSEISTVDMALFLAGAITAGEYFGGDIKTKAALICGKVNWNYFYVAASKQFSHGSSYAGAGVMPNTWDRPGDEAMIVSLIALASNPDSGDFLGTMYSQPRITRSYAGHSLVNSYFGSLFTYITGHCFFDFEKLGKDNPILAVSPAVPVDWWANSVQAAYANRQFCIDQSVNYSSYGPDSWGITACERPANDYYAGLLGAAPCECNNGVVPTHDGTIAPYGAISCLPLVRTSPAENLGDNLAFKALKFYHDTYYNNLWGPYGPRDSFNDKGEFNPYYYGLDLGSIVMMIENYRTRLIWNTFMKNEKVKAATAKVFGPGGLPPAKTLYVNAANAADPNQDGSQAHPFSAIQKAIDVGWSNVTINVAAGQYAEAISIVGKLKMTLNGIIADRGNPTNAQMNAVIINGGNIPISVTIENAHDITINGFAICGDGDFIGTGYYGIYNDKSNNVSIKNNIIQDVGREWPDGNIGDGEAIYSVNSGMVTISDNLIQRNHGTCAGIYVLADPSVDMGSVVILRNSIIDNHSWESCGITANGIPILIQNNFLFNNHNEIAGTSGITVYSVKGEIINNLLSSNMINRMNYFYSPPLSGVHGIYCYNSNIVIRNNTLDDEFTVYNGSPVVKNNIFCRGANYIGNGFPIFVYNNYSGGGSDYGVIGTGSIVENPMFIKQDTGDGVPYNDDYNLQPTSPCINAGDPDIAYNDLDGTRNDMGIYGGPTPMPDGI